MNPNSQQNNGAEPITPNQPQSPQPPSANQNNVTNNPVSNPNSSQKVFNTEQQNRILQTQTPQQPQSPAQAPQQSVQQPQHPAQSQPQQTQSQQQPVAQNPSNPVSSQNPSNNSQTPQPVGGVVSSSYPANQNPVSSQTFPNNGMSGGGNKKKKNIKMAVFGVAGLVILSGLIFGIMTFLSSDKLTLIEETESGITYKRPKQWFKVEEEKADIAYADTENKEESKQGMLIAKQPLGANYDSFSDSQKDLFAEGFKKGFSDSSSLESDNCKETKDVSITESDYSSYSTSFIIEAICTESTSLGEDAKIKMLVGVKGSDIQLSAIVATNENWDKNSEVYEEIFSSVEIAE